MLPMIPLEVDEVIAMGQHLVASKRRGVALWEAFWRGGPADESEDDERTPNLATLPEQPVAVLRASCGGMSVPWTLAASTVLGVWLMAAPGALGVTGAAAHVQTLGGSLVVTTSIIAMGEPVRLLRWLNVLLGIAVGVGCWVVGSAAWVALQASIVGLVVSLLAAPRGPKRERYGSWDPLVR